MSSDTIETVPVARCLCEQIKYQNGEKKKEKINGPLASRERVCQDFLLSFELECRLEWCALLQAD